MVLDSTTAGQRKGMSGSGKPEPSFFCVFTAHHATALSGRRPNAVYLVLVSVRDIGRIVAVSSPPVIPAKAGTQWLGPVSG
jgi:hypothetical protein